MDAAGNPLACSTADGLRQRLRRAVRQMRPIVQIPAESNGEHALLLDGFRKGDAAEAALRMLRHRTRSATDIIAMLERQGVSAL
jgi:DNA-binding FadR family transcriptional regulator